MGRGGWRWWGLALLLLVGAGCDAPVTPSAVPAPASLTPLPAPAGPAASVTVPPGGPATPTVDVNAPSLTAPLPDRILSLAFADPQHGWALSARPCPSEGCPHELFRTTDGEQTWDRLAPARDLSADQLRGVTQLRFVTAQDGWAFGPDLWTTHDGGQTWAVDPVVSNVQGLEVHDGTAWLLDVLCDVKGLCDHHLRTSADGGRTWHLVSITPPIAGDAGIPRLLWPGGQDGWIQAGSHLAATHDGGQTWAALPDIDCPGGSFFSQLAALPNGELWVFNADGQAAGSQPKYLCVSPDGVQHWQLRATTPKTTPGAPGVLPGGYVNSFTVSAPQRAWLTMQRFYNFVGSADGGRTWQPVPAIAEFDALGNGLFYFLDEQHGWATQDNAIFRTTDGGATWAPSGLLH